MDSYEAEKRLSFLYFLSLLLSLIALVTSAVSFKHWEKQLDTCLHIKKNDWEEELEETCTNGCLLYGTETFTKFIGGVTEMCTFIMYSPVPVMIVSVLLGGFHSYRVCIVLVKSRKKVKRTRRSGASTTRTYDAEDMDRRNSSLGCWTPLALLCALMTVLVLVTAAILTDGYYETCKEYRKAVVKKLPAEGSVVDLVHERLSCGAILEFIDYVEANNFKSERIQTSICLQMAVSTSWLNFINWGAILTYNSVLARHNRNI